MVIKNIKLIEACRHDIRVIIVTCRGSEEFSQTFSDEEVGRILEDLTEARTQARRNRLTDAECGVAHAQARLEEARSLLETVRRLTDMQGVPV